MINPQTNLPAGVLLSDLCDQDDGETQWLMEERIAEENSRDD